MLAAAAGLGMPLAAGLLEQQVMAGGLAAVTQGQLTRVAAAVVALEPLLAGMAVQA
jgi:hypothetical protein